MTTIPHRSSIVTPLDEELRYRYHLEIHAADRQIIRLLRRYAAEVSSPSLLEIGPAAGRLTVQVAKRIRAVSMTAIDTDGGALEILRSRLPSCAIVHEDVNDWHPDRRFPVIYSQGLDHHMRTQQEGSLQIPSYLYRVRELLMPGGVYIIGDETLGPYRNATERDIRLAEWYLRVIGAAMGPCPELARDEAEIFFEDFTADRVQCSPTDEQRELILRSAAQYVAQLKKTPDKSAVVLRDMLGQLRSSLEGAAAHVATARWGDRKVSIQEAITRSTHAGLGFEDVFTFGHGPGGMSAIVYRAT